MNRFFYNKNSKVTISDAKMTSDYPNAVSFDQDKQR